MEWRCFFPARPEFLEALNINRLLGEARNTPPAEKRADNYVVATDDLGVKFRGEKKLEMKVCLHRGANAIEHWVKHGLSVPNGGSIRDSLTPFVARYPAVATALQSPVAAAVPPTILMDKERVQFVVDGVLVEQCFMNLTIPSAPTGTSLPRYFSLCLEAPTVGPVETLVARVAPRVAEVAAAHPQGPHGWPQGVMGYPEFAVKLWRMVTEHR